MPSSQGIVSRLNRMSTKNDDSSIRHKSSGVLDKLHNYIDSNIQLVRNGLYVVCGVGVILIGRSYYITQVFNHASEIPSALIHQNIRILGRVREITNDGMLKVRHIPLVRVPFRGNNRESCLLVKLACLDVSPEGRLWLNNAAVNKRVWLQILYREIPVIHCSVKVPRLMRSKSVNEALMKRGLCKVSSTHHLQNDYGEKLVTNRTLLRYLDRMVYLESIASRRETGMWKINKPSDKTWTKTTLNLMKTVMSGPFRLVDWVYKKAKRKRNDNN